MSHQLATVTDDRYVLGTAVMLESLYSTTPDSHGSTFYVLHDPEDLSEHSKESLLKLFDKKFKIIFCTSPAYLKQKDIVHNIFKDSYGEQGWSFSILLQAYLPDAIDSSVDKVCYIDSDTIFVKDASDFLSFNLKLPIAAQLDHGVSSQNQNPTYPYFNAGVYITSLRYWRENSLLDRFEPEMFNTSPFHAQNFLNLVFKNNWQLLGPQINVPREKLGIEDFIDNSNILKKENFIFSKSPILVHYLGQPKPWTKKYQTSIGDNWRSLGKRIWIDDYYFNILKNVKIGWMLL
jgi:lipopolysaccharide biosynthesis glycosyltransferase